MTDIRETALEFLGRGGKKLRPRLCLAVYRAARAQKGGPEPAGDIEALLEAVECFHKASLVHDDIQDGDETRYGKPSVWKEHGVPAAIAVGDWLVAYGYTRIRDAGFADTLGMLGATIESHKNLCEGQGDELLSGVTDANRISVYRRKTGEAFALAAELGARAADVDPTPYRRYALAYGTLFQINDDIADGGETPELLELRKKYEDETALYRDECALGVW